ncbi:MAG: hypothetical protein HDT47_05130 [Ruminococcaceae bacterium]|nr:hypothetical protein [Oscillospiraceae bacterium]
MNTHTCTLNIAGKNANDIYQVNVPSNLLGFCKYDFTHFMEDCNQLCRDCMKSGEYPLDEVNVIRNSISSCHRYYENNIRGIFDKIVVDCWIEYICRQGEMGTSTLWESLIECKTPFQRVIFQRLSEYRSHHAINQWVNLLKIQEYARKKLDYIFGCKLNGVDEATGRLNVFDLMFSVAANEQGYSLDTISSVKEYKPGRLPNSPFVFSGAAKEIMRNLFKNVHFAESLPYVSTDESAMSDWEAMNAFAVIKSYLPDHSDNVVNTIIKSMVKITEKVYVPSGFKAFIDLEIDALINSGAFLQRCRRCKEFYVRDEYYTSEYCDTVQRDGSTCREIMEQPKFDPPTPEQLEELKEKSDSLYREISDRVGKSISQRDFTEWLSSFNVIKNKVINGEARPADFDDFVLYTKDYSFPIPIEPVKEEVSEATPDGKKTVKPYQFTRIDRKELEQSGLLKPADKKEETPSPIKKEKAAVPPPPPVAKIIRGANPTSYQEIPVRAVGGDSSSGAPKIKQDVYLGEDFSDSGQAESAGASARAAIQSITDSERLKSESAQDSVKDNAAESKSNTVSNASTEKPHFLPDLEHFADISDIEESTEIGRPKAPKIKLPDFNSLEEKHAKPDNDGFLDLFAEKEVKNLQDERNSGREMEAESKKTVQANAYSKYNANSAYGTGKRSNRNVPNGQWGMGDENRRESGLDLDNHYGETEIPETRSERMGEDRFNDNAEKPAEANRAARVVNAYRTVTEMPVSEEVRSDREKDPTEDDFSKILDSIERSDGFGDEEVPLDADGVPLSHKTKHVMDAIMKNTGVSPSLIYGRRQAAEKNVVLDDTFGEKSGKKQ